MQGSNYILLNALGSHELADGKYLYDPATKTIDVQWISGIGSERAAAPQARLMATVINGILRQQLPWGLVLLGVFLVIAIELMGVRSLTFAVGSYLSIATTFAIFVGGVVRWMVDRAAAQAGEETRRERDQSGVALRQRADCGGRHRGADGRGHEAVGVRVEPQQPGAVPADIHVARLGGGG